MSKTLPPESDIADLAGAVIRTSDDAVGPSASDAAPFRVRELPPLPKAADEPRLPRIEVDTSRPRWWRRWWSRRTSSGCVASFVFHFCLLLGLALVVDRTIGVGEGPWGELVAGFNVPVPLDSEMGDDRSEPLILEPGSTDADAPTPDRQSDLPKIAEANWEPAGRDDARCAAFNLPPAALNDWLARTDAPVGGGLQGRGRDARAALVHSGGGNGQSERAVERGLRWLAAHQLDNGSWNFDHRKSVCRGQCRNPGDEASTTAATAMALLPFLGAGYTHRQGEHRDVVNRGLYYLGNRAMLTQNGNDFQEGTMYAQGLAAIALGEAYAMTDDPSLKPVAQGAIDFIVYAQDPKGGGWRYTPGEPGDTTVTGWQLMGLKSGQMARLSVPSPTIYMVRRFLDSVQYEDGSQYGYLDRLPRKTTTAVGLLCRMYTGWRRSHPGLQRGVVYLSNWGPSRENIYYDYYATQVMHHWGGELWNQWNVPMRDYLIQSQAAGGHEAGSWFFARDRGAKAGGRLYGTAMAVMTLEVYYRYMPLYGRESVEDEF